MSKNSPFECVALLLQGGGALGSYQAGVYQALAEAELHPDWVAGISIGSINSALIAGNAPDERVNALREFWELITAPTLLTSWMTFPMAGKVYMEQEDSRRWINQMSAFNTALGGAPGFFSPRPVPTLLAPNYSDAALSFYDTRALHTTLNRLVDFDRINSGETRFSAGAVNVRTGNYQYFDNTTDTIDSRHVVASGSLPPGFPATEIEGEKYWDGGVVSNTPLQWVLDRQPRQDTLAFQVDLWNAKGDYPKDLTSQDVRLKEIRYSSRTRHSTDRFRQEHKMRQALAHLIEQLPAETRAQVEKDPKLHQLMSLEANKVYNIVHLIYRAKTSEVDSKDFEFSRATMRDHWAAGYKDTVTTLEHPDVLKRSSNPDGLSIFDLTE